MLASRLGRRLGLRRQLARLFLGQGKLADQRVGPSFDASGHVARLELGDDELLDDDRRQPVGENAFEAITDLDPQLALIRRDDQQRAGVLLLVADPPGAAQAVAIVGDFVAFEAGQGRHHQLALRLGFQRRQLLVEPRFDIRRDDVRGIGHPAGEFGKRLRQGGGGDQQHARRPQQRQDE